jgi:hypothetical protein
MMLPTGDNRIDSQLRSIESLCHDIYGMNCPGSSGSGASIQRGKPSSQAPAYQHCPGALDDVSFILGKAIGDLTRAKMNAHVHDTSGGSVDSVGGVKVEQYASRLGGERVTIPAPKRGAYMGPLKRKIQEASSG